MPELTSEQIAANLAAQFEGFSAAPYLDIGGVPTQGYGSTRGANNVPITMKDPPITEDTGLEWLSRDMGQAFVAIASYVKVPLTGNQKAALADFIYNEGAGNFSSSTLLRLLNVGDFSGASAQFLVWDVAGGEMISGLLRRREAEKALFNTPDDD
jgi:lysozyme